MRFGVLQGSCGINPGPPRSCGLVALLTTTHVYLLCGSQDFYADLPDPFTRLSCHQHSGYRCRRLVVTHFSQGPIHVPQFTRSPQYPLVKEHLDLQTGQNNGPFTACTLYFGILGHYFGLFWRSRHTLNHVGDLTCKPPGPKAAPRLRSLISFSLVLASRK